ncbi:MAG: CoA transferase, partial [Alphaproteobacteria bacterium]|nr:CoA transferase [Alphaproteobacteria bacterium]
MQACAGIQVLEMGRGFGVTALCGQLFAGLGATVRVIQPTEELAGPATAEGRTYLSHLLHAGKERIAFDPATITAEELAPLLDWADVIIVDRTAGGPFASLSDLQTFEAEHPGKILCAVSLFGARSERPDWVGNELIAEAAGALMACNGYPERAPVSSGLPYALHTCALFAFNAIMTALWERDRSERGQTIDLSVVDSITAILGNFLPSYFLTGRTPQRIGNRHTIAAPWNIYPALDGSVVICTGTGGTGWWAKVMKVLERPDLVDDPRYATESDRVRNVDEVDAIMSEWTCQHTMQDIVSRMTVLGIPVSEIGTIEAVMADPHYRDRRAMVLEDPASPLPLAGIPLKVGAWHSDNQPGPRDPERILEDNKFRGKGSRSGKGPLSGIRVLEFASRTSVPLAGRLMADLGADIVKIEPLKGDALRGAGQQIGGSSYLFHINNAGKRSVVINPNDPTGRDLIIELARDADIFMENLAPGSLDKMGLGASDLLAVNPELIYCSVSGFGMRSNYGSKRALDTVVQAACGLMYMTGYPDHFPVKLGISAVDLTTATATMAGVLAGLRERPSTRKGMHIDLAMADIGVWMTQRVWPQLLCEGEHPIRLGNRSAESCPHNIFQCTDERFVAIAVEDDVTWRALATLMGRPELAEGVTAMVAGRLGEIEAIEAAVAEWTVGKSADKIAALCQAHGIPAAKVRDLVELVADGDTSARDMVVPITHPTAGDIRLLGNPLALSRTPPVITRGAPMLGQHSEEVLAGIGLTAD